jgi:hypothetical protein
VRLFYVEEVYKYDTVNRGRGIICEVVLCGGSVIFGMWVHNHKAAVCRVP